MSKERIDTGLRKPQKTPSGRALPTIYPMWTALVPGNGLFVDCYLRCDAVTTQKTTTNSYCMLSVLIILCAKRRLVTSELENFYIELELDNQATLTLWAIFLTYN